MLSGTRIVSMGRGGLRGRHRGGRANMFSPVSFFCQLTLLYVK